MNYRPWNKKQLSYIALVSGLVITGTIASTTAHSASVPEVVVDQAAVCKASASRLSCGSGLLESMHNTGNVALKGTFVRGETLVTGSFRATDAKLNNVNIVGSSQINESVVAGPVKLTGHGKFHDSHFSEPVQVSGNIQSANDTFANDLVVAGKLKMEAGVVQGLLTAASKELHFSGTDLNSLQLNGSSGAKGAQLVYLQDHTSVAGDINFAGGHGKVFLGQGSVINGKVTGGEVVKA